jgi:hypothetical protein
MQDAPGSWPSPLQSKWIELRDEVHERSYWVDLHSVALQSLLDPIPLPDGRNPHADRLERSWIAPPPDEPECMRPYAGSRIFKARARGLRPTSPAEASAWLDLDYTTPDTLVTVVRHYRARLGALDYQMVDDGWFRHPDESHRLVAMSEDGREQVEVMVNNFGPTTLIHKRYTVFVPGEFHYQPPALLHLQVDHYDDECEILYLHHAGDGQYFGLSRYLMELCSQSETEALPGGELARSILLPEWLPAFPGQRASVLRGVVPLSRARFVDLSVKTAAPIEAVVDFYRRIADELKLKILGESETVGRRSLLAYDPDSRFRFEVVAAEREALTDVSLNYWEYPMAVEEPQA